MNAKRNRVCPDLGVGDEVKKVRKRKPNEKERVGNFSQSVYTIESIDKKWGQTYYYIENIHRACLSICVSTLFLKLWRFSQLELRVVTHLATSVCPC